MKKSPNTNAKSLLQIAIAMGLSNILYAVMGTFIRQSPEKRPITPLPEWIPNAIYLVCGVMLVAAVIVFGKLAEKGRQALAEGDTTHQVMIKAMTISNMMIEVPALLGLAYMFVGHSITPLYICSVLCALTYFCAVFPKVTAYIKEADMNSVN